MRISICLFLLLQASLIPASAAQENNFKNNIQVNSRAISLLNSNKNELSLTSINPAFYSPHDIVEIYYIAIGNGELVVFNILLDKSMLTPTRVEYIYEIASNKTSRKIYSDLKNHLSMPGQNCCLIKGVSAILDERGHIVETEIHLISKI